MACRWLFCGPLIWAYPGQETRDEIEAMEAVKARIEAIRLRAGPIMGFGDVTNASVPKMTLVSAPMQGGAINTRSVIPKRVHASVRVFAAVSVATACLLPDSPAAAPAVIPPDGRYAIKHLTGSADVFIDLAPV